jgi:hypothetical protein
VRERHRVAEGVGQGEIKGRRPLREGLLGRAGLDELRDGPRQILQQVSGELAPLLSVKLINVVL